MSNGMEDIFPPVATTVAVATPDSIPGKPKPRRGRPSKARASGAPKPTTKSTLSDELEGMLQMLSFVWGTRDDVCGPVLERQAPAIAKELSAWLMDHPKARKWVESLIGAGGSMGLFLAVWPIMQTVRDHHVKPRIEAARAAREAEAAEWPKPEQFDASEPAEAPPLGWIPPDAR